MEHSDIPSVIGHLLEELSWSGRKIKEVRGGGRGTENVLTAEVLQALDFLPRNAFLGAVLQATHGAQPLKDLLLTNIEQAFITVLPGSMPLDVPTLPKCNVQPDAVISAPNAYCVVEAKRMGYASFQPRQLARELTLAYQQARAQTIDCHQSGVVQPALLVILGHPPPVRVQRRHQLSIEDAIVEDLPKVVVDDVERQLICSQIAETVLWITWSEIAFAVDENLRDFKTEDASTYACVRRLSETLLTAIKWHNAVIRVADDYLELPKDL